MSARNLVQRLEFFHELEASLNRFRDAYICFGHSFRDTESGNNCIWLTESTNLMRICTP